MTNRQFLLLLLSASSSALLGGALGTAFLQGGTVGAQKAEEAPRIHESVSARKFVLVDENGVTRSELSRNEAGATVLRMCDAEDNDGLVIEVTDTESNLRMGGAKDKPGIRLATIDGTKGTGRILVMGRADGQPAFTVHHGGPTENGKMKWEETLLSFGDKANKPQIVLGTTRDNTSQLAFFGPAGDPLASLISDSKKGSVMRLSDSGSSQVMVMAQDSIATAHFKAGKNESQVSAIADKGSVWQTKVDGKFRFVAGAGEDDVSRIILFDAEQKEQWKAEGKK
jgi:hypothetical protein